MALVNVRALSLVAVFVAFFPAGLLAQPKPTLTMTMSYNAREDQETITCDLQTSTDIEVPGAWRGNDTSRLVLQKRQFTDKNEFVSMNDHQGIVAPFPTDKVVISTLSCVANSTAGTIGCNLRVTISKPSPVDGGWYRCQLVPDKNANETWESSELFYNKPAAPDNVDLILVDETDSGNPPTYGVLAAGNGEGKIYDFGKDEDLSNLTLRCEANGTFDNPSLLKISDGGKTVSCLPIKNNFYRGDPGYMTSYRRLIATCIGDKDAPSVASLVGKDVVCKAIGIGGEIASSIIVRRRVPPEIKCDQLSVKGKLGDDAKFKCVITGVSPDDEIWWHVGGTDSKVFSGGKISLPATPNLRRMKIALQKVADQTAYDVHLSISGLEESDYATESEGKYKLTAKNKYGKTTKAISIAEAHSSSAPCMLATRVQWYTGLVAMVLVFMK